MRLPLIAARNSTPITSPSSHATASKQAFGHETYREAIDELSRNEKKGAFDLIPHDEWPKIVQDSLKTVYGKLNPSEMLGPESKRLAGIVEEKSDCAFQASAAAVFALGLLDYPTICNQ